MKSVKGTFQNGVAQPTEPVEGYEGQSVIITFVGEAEETKSMDDSDWDSMLELLEGCAMDTGIGKLAYERDTMFGR